MNRTIRYAIPAIALAAVIAAQTHPPATQGLPPLIDRELLFGNPEIAAAQLSPDGKYLAFLKPWNDTRNVWVKGTAEPFSAARLLTAETKRPIPGFLWSRDAKYVVFVKDHDGDENFNVYAVDPAAAPAAGASAPPARDLTGAKGVQVQLYSTPKSDPGVVYIGLNDRDKAWHDLYRLKLSTGEKTLLRKNTDRVAQWFFDLQGQLRLALRTTPSGDTEVLRVDPAGFNKVYDCNVFEGCGPLRFHKDGKRVYMETNKGPDVDLTALVLLDPQTGKVEPVESDPLKKVDFGNAMFSEVTGELVMTSYREEKVRRYYRDKAVEADYHWLAAKMPGKEIGVASRTLDETLWLVNIGSDTEPGETYLFNRKAKRLTLQYRVREKLPREALTPMQTIRYQSSDGLEIPAYLTLPKGIPAKSLPTLVVPHGGPWARDAWGYNPMAQFFANRGYAVLMPNFRGSTGYGKKFLNAGNGEWGRKMQDDLTWGVKHLVAEGIADPKRIGILGGSYGGYATLAGVAFTPDLYRAAVDIVGPSNLRTLLESIPPYWEAGRKIMYARMADMGTPEGIKWLEERSPLNSANKITTPLLVVQGANDPRVNRAEAERIVIALRDRGFPVEYLLAPDEGHGFARPVNNMAMFMAAEKFLAKQLDGRYQEGATPEVAARLKEITVDPKSVVLTKKVDPASIATPKPAAALEAGTFAYKATLSVGGRELPLKLATVVKEENGAWVLTDTVETPMGPAVDSVTLEKGTLLPKSRSVKQGAVSMAFDLSATKVSGKINANGKDIPVNVDLDGPLFADGAGSSLVIAALPLAEGYSAIYRNLDLQKQKVKVIEAKVVASESVTVPAGTFDTYKVEIATADGSGNKSTLWIAKQTRKPVKMSSIMAQAGGAVMVAELEK
jgi:dipeptidyl aminopeptidase/acylaminoacyl peptidase